MPTTTALRSRTSTRIGRRTGARALLLSTVHGDHAPVRIQTLGGFGVTRAGSRVTACTWQSKKARDLLKVLIARRGHPVPRDVLIEALWPLSDGDLPNRLSVALTTVRSVFDPERRMPHDSFIAGDRDTVALRLDQVDVDVERFLALVARGDELKRLGRVAEAIVAWTRAASHYRGDFLEEEPLELVSALREQARASFVTTARRLAAVAAERADIALAERYLVCLLERDPHDEDAHRGMVSCLWRSGRFAEAERHFRTYVVRMRELGVTAVPLETLKHQTAAGYRRDDSATMSA